jgi:hypothetical protein
LHKNSSFKMRFVCSHIPFGVTSWLVDPLLPTVLAPLRITSESQASSKFISFISTNKRFLWFYHMKWNKPQCELFYITNFAIFILLTLWDLLEASTSGTFCTSTLVHLPYGAATVLLMYNNEFQWLLKVRFHIIYYIVVTSVQRNSYRIIRVDIYTHFSSKSISRATMLPLTALVFQ